ncbi:zinc-dependent metalloprotease [Pyxidicoccus sp. 3LG]
MRKQSTPWSHGLLVLFGVLSLLGAGCASEQEPPPALTLDGAFVAVPRVLAADEQQQVKSGLGAAAVALRGDGSETFYLAIRKSALPQRYFLNAYLKTQWPQHIQGGAAYPLGARVVSFELQNGRLYAFDVDSRKVQSDLFAPEVLVDAWPIITDHAAFNGHPRAKDYVLFDPTAGLNRFGIMGDREAAATYRPFRVELSFAQRFRALEDGIAYEQVFTGYADWGSGPLLPENEQVETNPLRISGTLALSLRLYQESPGYVATPLPAREHYFRSEPMLVPNSGGVKKQVVAKWAIQPGMKPIPWVITHSVLKLQQDPRFQGYDLVGAMKRGIEGWNAAFGFQALTARVGTPDESFSDTELNTFILDPDRSYGFAGASWYTNPNTGEVRGASVYMDVRSIETFIRLYRDDPPAPTVAGEAPVEQPSAPSQDGAGFRPVWNGLAAEWLCTQHVTGEEDLTRLAALAEPLPRLTKKEKVERALAGLVAHEIGHTLGLRHNFKGSFSRPSSSVMEYLLMADTVYRDTPGPYDVAAIRYLYGLSSTLPQEPFCTDEDTSVDPDCMRYDRSEDPLHLWSGAIYTPWLADALVGQDILPDDFSINELLQFVRAGRSSAEKVDAWNILTETLRAPIPPERLASHPQYGPAADFMLRRIIQRAYLDPPELRGMFQADIRPDAQLTPVVLEQLRGMLLDLDGVRTPSSRRVAVDVLQKLQSYEAYAILMEAHAALQASLPGLDGNERLAAVDLSRRIERATSPYFIY